MKKFKRTYYKPVELTVTLTDAEEQEILEDLKEEGFEKGDYDFEDALYDATNDKLYDKFADAAKEYMKKHGVEIEPDYDEDIEEVE